MRATVAVALTLLCLLQLTLSASAAVQVSPKLDFGESREDSAGAGRPTPGGGKSPKISGVRVVVDTTKTRKSTESTEDGGGEARDDSQLKTVGIRTDITLELSDNATDDADDEDEDAADDGTRNKTSVKTTRKKTTHTNIIEVVDRDDDSSNAGDRRVPVIKGSATGGGAPKPAGPSSEETGGWNVHNVPVVYGKEVYNGQRRRWDRPQPPVAALPPPRPPVATWQPALPPAAAERPTKLYPHYYITDYYPRPPSFKPAVPWKPVVTAQPPCRCAPPQPSYRTYPPASTQWKTYQPDARRAYVQKHSSSSASSSRGVDEKLEYPFTSNESAYK